MSLEQNTCMVDSQSHKEYDDVVSRRKFVALTGVTGAAALAGCTGGDDEGNGDNNSDDNGDNNSDDNGDGNQDYDVWFETGNWNDPTSVQFNPYNPASLGGQLENAVWEEFAKYNIETGEWVSWAAANWDIAEDSVTLEIRDDLVWNNGEDVTAEDVVTGMRLQEYQDGEIWDFAESVEAPDDTTVEISLEGSANSEIVRWVLLTGNINASQEEYGEYLERLEDGEDEDEVMSELASWNNREPITCGPFEFSDEDSTNQYMAAPAFDDHPDADNINFSGYHMYQRSSNEAYHSSLINGEFDGLLSLFVPAELIDAQFPDTVDEIQIPGTFGAGIHFNHDHDVFGQREVRQAIAFATDWELAAQNADPSSKQVPEVPCGITTAAIQDYLGDDIDDFESYDQDQERAAELLEEAGFEQDGDTWVDENGDPISATVIYPSGWSDFVAAAETVVSQLNDFGFELELEGQERGTLEENLGNSDFELANFEWNEGAVQFNHPYYSLRHNLQNRQLNSEESFFKYPESVEVPARDGDGTMEVDLVQRLNDLASEADEDAANEIIKELAWVVNQDLPIMPVQSKFEQSFLSNDGWEYPDPESEEMQALWPLYWQAKQGNLQATGE